MCLNKCSDALLNRNQNSALASQKMVSGEELFPFKRPGNLWLQQVAVMLAVLSQKRSTVIGKNWQNTKLNVEF